ncbi:MAG: hypothetical protein VW270_02510 [Candidatus Poseidoniales archaeon]
MVQVYFPTENLEFNIARGLVRDTFDVHKFGSNSNIGNGVANIETVWDGSNLYPWSTWDSGADNIYLASTNSADTSRQIEIQGLDASYNLQTETVTLNASDATTAVATTNTFIRVFRMRNTGSTTCAGNITAKYASSGGTTIAQITAGNEQTLMAIYTVPANHDAYLLQLEGSSKKNNEITMRLAIRSFGGVFRNNHQCSFIGNQYLYPYSIPFKIEPKSDIDIRAFAGAAGVSVDATFNMVLIKNPIGP